MSRTLEQDWSRFKPENSTFVVDLYKNSNGFMVVSVALVAVAAALIIVKHVIIRDNAGKRFQRYLKKTKRFHESSKRPVTKIRRLVKRNLRP